MTRRSTGSKDIRGINGNKNSGNQQSSPNVFQIIIVIGIIALIVYFAINSDKLSTPDVLGPTATPTPLVDTPTARPTLTRRPTSARPTATTAPGQPTPTTAPLVVNPGELPFEVFFTRPVYPDRATTRGDAPIYDRFVQLLDSATKSIDIAIYEFDLPNATTALVNAKKRGVTVRMVTDSDSTDGTDELMTTAYTKLQKAKITVVSDGRSAIMHDKFVVVDGRWVWMGSWNFTEGDTFRLNNNAALIDSPALAANYSAEFNRMFTNKTFGPAKKKGSDNPNQVVNGAPVQNYFAPVDKIVPHLIDLVNSAQKSVYFMAFQFTEDNLGSAMAARAQAGIDVKGVFETTGSDTKFSEYGKLKPLGIPVYTDGNPYIMHEKVIIVDEKTVAFGSYNFSASAEDSNDENILIVDSPALAAQFVQEFNYVLGVAQNKVNK